MCVSMFGLGTFYYLDEHKKCAEGFDENGKKLMFQPKTINTRVPISNLLVTI
jgi:hypothetical protein